MAGEDRLIAEVEGKPIYFSRVIQTISDMGEAGAKLRNEEGIKQVGEELINQELLYLDAKKNKLDEDPQYLAALEQMKEDLLKQYAMQKLLNCVTVEEEELKEYYESHKEQLATLMMQASHILVDSEEKAKEVTAEIEAGMSFSEAARNFSTCPSSTQGGDLGIFGPGQMVPEFDQVVQNAPLHEIQGPVKTQFGYHLILVTKRSEEVPTFEEAKVTLRQKYGLLKQQEAYLHKVHELRKEYNTKSHL